MSTKRKILIYQKNESRPISLTEESAISDKDLTTQLTTCFKSENITTLEIGKDIIIIRPSEISAMAIFPFQNDSIKSVGPLESKDSPQSYNEELSLEVESKTEDSQKDKK